MKNKNNNPDDNFIPNEDDELNFRSEDFYKDFDEEQNFNNVSNKSICPVCNATDSSCSFCQGEGEISSDDSFTDFIDDLDQFGEYNENE